MKTLWDNVMERVKTQTLLSGHKSEADTRQNFLKGYLRSFSREKLADSLWKFNADSNIYKTIISILWELDDPT